MTLTKTTDHVGEALDHLIEQHKNKPKMAAFLTALVNQIQDLEDASFEVYLDRWIDSAVGVQLDGLGAIIGEPRLGRGDDEYRLAIKARIQINFSEATPEDILTALVNFYNRTYEMIEIPPAAFIIRLVDAWVSSTDPDPQDFVELLNSVNGAGIKAWFQYSLVDDDNAFTFASGDALEASETQGFGVDPLFVAVASTGTNRVMTSVDGIDWTARAAAENNEWQSVTHGGLFVAVSSDGTNRVMTSPNGIDWTARTAAENNEWRSVTFGAGLFVAVASSGVNRVMTSPDGIAWTARSAAAANEWRSVTYDDGLFVAVSSTGDNRVMTSPNGIDWTSRQSITGPDVIVDGDMEVTGPDVIVDGDMEVTGPDVCLNGDFSAWADPTVPDNWAKFGTHDANNYVEESGGGGCRLVSDGTLTGIAQVVLTIGKTYRIKVDVTDATSGSITVGIGAPTLTLSSVGSFELVAIATSTSLGVIRGGACDITIDNLEVIDETVACAAWTVGSAALLSKQGDAYEGAQCLRVQYGGVTQPYAAQAILTIGKTYRVKGQARADFIGGGIPRVYNPGGAGWVFEGVNTTTDWQSIDVVFVATHADLYFRNYRSIDTYAEFDDITVTDETVACAAYSIGNAALLSKQGDAYEGSQCLRVDYNGTNYPYGYQAILTIGKTYRIRGRARGDGTNAPEMYDGANIWQGTTSTSWQAFDVVSVASATWLRFFALATATGYCECDDIEVIVDNAWESVIYGDGLFVAVSSTGDDRIMTSPDGVVWTARTAAELNAWRSVTHDEGLFVAVSSDGTNRVQTSPDGITWTARVAAEDNEWRSVAHDNGLFVAVASTGTNQVMTSPDGTVWTARAEAEANAWESIERGYATGGIMSEIVEV